MAPKDKVLENARKVSSNWPEWKRRSMREGVRKPYFKGAESNYGKSQGGGL